MRLRYLHRRTGGENTTPTTSDSRSCTDCSSDPSRSPPVTPCPHPCALVRTHLLIRLPRRPASKYQTAFRCFQLAHATPPGISRLIEQASHERPDPFAPPPITGASPLLRVVRRRPTASVLNPSRFRAAWDAPLATQSTDSIRVRLLPFHTKAADRLARLNAGHHLASKRVSARLIPRLH